MIYFDIILFALGTMLLYYGSNILIDNSSALAKKYNISKVVIGMTLVALGTSFPEFVVSIIAIYKGEIDLVIGNILGSNIANIGLVLGFSSLFYEIKYSFRSVRVDALFLVIASLLFSGILHFQYFNFTVGLSLLFIFGIYIYTLVNLGRIDEENMDDSDFDSSRKLMILIFLGMASLSAGSNMLINSAINIANYFNISSMIIGITAVALGTSLPELATSFSAARKNEFGLLLGNIFGSNVINIVFVFGSSLLINESIPKVVNYSSELILFLCLTILLILSLIYGKISRFMGAFFLITYIYFILRMFSIL